MASQVPVSPTPKNIIVSSQSEKEDFDRRLRELAAAVSISQVFPPGHKLSTNRTQMGHKSNTQPDTHSDTSSSSSSYININKETTTTGGLEVEQVRLLDSKLELTPKWREVDFTSLASIGFTQTHLIQIVSQAKLTPEIVQDNAKYY